MVTPYTVGSVPYLNAKPLVKPLIWAGEASPVKVEFDVPSLLPERLETKQAQAIMVSSISALQEPGSAIADGLSISTQREVLSVRLFSKVPFDQIATLAEDHSSMTSNALAKILLAELHGVQPVAKRLPPSGDDMLLECDACVLIGDNGMRFDGAGFNVMDLGQAWHDLTELPFVWAVWKGRESLTEELVGFLQDSLSAAQDQMDRVVQESSDETGFTLEQCRHYLLNVMDYRLTEDHLRGLSRFGEKLKDHGLVQNVYEPIVVNANRPIRPLALSGPI